MCTLLAGLSFTDAMLRSRRCIPGVMHTNLLLDMVLYVYIKIRTSLFDANSRCTRAHLFVERKVAKVDEICQPFSHFRLNANTGQELTD